jgi:hypothetical protein
MIFMLLIILFGAALSLSAPPIYVTAQSTDILILPLPTDNNNSIPHESSDDTTICCHQFSR